MPVDPKRILHVFDSLDYQLAIYDRVWRYTYVNEEAARMLGRSPAELVGRSIWDLFPDMVGRQYHRELHDVVHTGQAIHSEHLHEPSGRWFEHHIYPLPEGVFVLARDVTEARAAAEELRHRQSMMRIAQHAGGVGTFEWDFARGQARCSAEFFRIFGLPAEDGVIASEAWGTYVHPEDRERMTTHLARALEGAEPAACDYRIVNASGDVRWLSYVGQFERTRDGDRMVGTVVDVTDRKRAEIALQEAKEAAESANRLKDQFLATLSHELRTPLNAILGYARLLQTGVITEDNRRRALDVIGRNALALGQLVDDLLDVSRITTGRIRLEPVPVHVDTVLREAIEAVRPAADAKRIGLQSTVDGGDDTVSADATRLQQVFWNLLSNAVKFTNPGGRVTVSRSRDGATVTVAVRDTGSGIAPEFLPHLFEPFRQAEARMTRGYAGLGLGLAISKQLVELHGGTIHAESEGVGQGATFLIRLPALAHDR